MWKKKRRQSGSAVLLRRLAGDESEAFRNVQKGTLPLAMGGIANLVPFEKKLGLLTLPYLFANIDEVVAGTNGAPAELLNKYATKAGFRILTWTYTDFRYISNSKRPITKMADMQGLKFRVPQSAVLIAAYKAFGGSPTPISWAETFTALQQGVVDGQCYGYIGFKANKFNEANQKYLTEVHYTYQLQPLVISERVFKKMTPEMQKLLIDAGKYAQEKCSSTRSSKLTRPRNTSSTTASKSRSWKTKTCGKRPRWKRSGLKWPTS